MINKLERHSLNCNVFSVYDYNDLDMQELLSTFFTKINECIDVSNNTFDLADWLVKEGLAKEVVKKLLEWLTDGTLEGIINENLFSSLNKKITSLEKMKEEVPYRDYKNGDAVTDNEMVKIYEGNSTFTKKTYGTYELASVVSVVTGEYHPETEVLGTDTKGLSKYESRDSVAMYVHNRYSDDSYTVTGCIFNSNECVLPVGVDMKRIKSGMIIHSEGSPKCVGIIKSVEGNILTMVDGWYEIKPGVGSTTKTTPTGNTCLINPKTKVWGINNNIFVTRGCSAGANMELGVFCNHSEINDVGGIDLVNFENSTHFGYKARGSKVGFQKGFVSEGSGVHFEGNGGDVDSPLIQAVNTDGSSFYIKNSGMMSKQKVNIQAISASGTMASDLSCVLLNGNNITVSLPVAEAGRIINVISLGTGNKMLAQTGKAIVLPTVSHQEIPFGTNGYCQLIGDGNNWYAIATSIVI